VHITVQLRRTEGRDPPYDHNFLLGSAVYHLLQEHSDEVSDVLHDSPYRSAYVLSEIHRVTGKPNESWFRVGTSNEAVAKNIEKALVPGTQMNIGKTVFRITGILMEEPVVRPGEYVTLSPILLLDKKTGKSLVYDSNSYQKILEEGINAQIKNNLKTKGEVRLLHIEPQGVRRRTIRERIVLAQKARLLLDGPEDELRFLVNHGIGRSPSLGFGMVVGTKPWQRPFRRIKDAAVGYLTMPIGGPP